ncbi:MAG: NAD-dependent epimerase/dehydratase family protein [Candidatus Gastranaerophilaceae bacterium]
MNVLVVGAAGFIGSNVVQKLLEYGYSVVAIDKVNTEYSSNKNFTFFQRDIVKDELEDIFKNYQIDYIIHLAGVSNVGLSITNPEYDAQVNIVGTINILNLAKKYKIKKLLTASSAAVYGNSETFPITEEGIKNPISPYGLSKLTMEKYIKLFDIPYIIFRCSNVYGKKESGCDIITKLDNLMKNNKEIVISGDGTNIRDFIYVKDVAEIFVNALNAPVENEVINLSTGIGTSIKDLINIMSKIYDYNQEITYTPVVKDYDIQTSILNNNKLLTLLPKLRNTLTDLEDGIRNIRNE